MSENQESAASAEQTANPAFDPMAVLPAHEESKGEGNTQLKDIEGSLDGQSYFLGEAPQSYLADPQAFLALNSDRLVGSTNMLESLLSEVALLIQDEVDQIQKAQKKINLWEDRIEKNKALVSKNLVQVKQNLVDISYDKKNRDYWVGRAEQVKLDYTHAAASDRENEWSWIIKKYGLKNPDGSSIDYRAHCVEELCNGAAANLESEYRLNGHKYETARKEKEEQNTRMIRENGKLLNTNDQLQGYISNTYSREIEPVQDGILLYKELGIKLKSLSQSPEKATYGDLRSWAESFLDDFLKANPLVMQNIVTEFRRLASIPLPAQNS